MFETGDINVNKIDDPLVPLEGQSDVEQIITSSSTSNIEHNFLGLSSESELLDTAESLSKSTETTVEKTEIITPGDVKGTEKEDIDTITGEALKNLNVTPLEEDLLTKTRITNRKRSKKIDPGSDAENAHDLDKIGKSPTTYNEKIGYRSGGSRDKSDYYKFTLQGQKKQKFNDLNIVLDGLNANANIQLFDEDGKTIIDQSRKKGKREEEINQILNNGTYYLNVQAQGKAKTQYSLSLSSDQVKDEDGKRKDAQDLGSLKKKPQRIKDDIGFQLGSVRDQKDFFEFSVNRDSEVTITLDALKEDANLKLLNKQGSLLFSSSNENREKEKINTILEKGKYFVEVAPESGDRTNYMLSLSADDEIEDPDGQIPGKNLGKLTSKTISKTDRIGSQRGFIDSDDFWEFQLTKETDLTINLDSLKANADLELYDSDGTTLIFSSKNEGREEEEIEAILEKGIYYVRVKSVGGSSTKYRLSLSGDTDITEEDDKLPGTSLGELGAEEVTQRDRIGFGRGSLRDFQDYYSFSLGEKSDVNISLDNLRANAELELLGIDGRTIEKSNKKGRASETIDSILAPGDYYVKVSPVGKAKTKYDLGLTANPAIDDYSNPKQAKEIGILYEENTYEETNEIGFKRGSVRDFADYFHFELAQSQQVNISLDNLRKNAGLQLLGGENGKKQIEISNEKGRQPEEINKDLEPGNYYVKVFSVGKLKTGYELSFEALSPDEAPYVVAPGIEDVKVKEDRNIRPFNVSKFFKDPDSRIETIEVTDNTNPGLVIPSEKNKNLKGKKLELELVKNQNGYGEITITATSKGKTVSDTFAVDVTPVDDPPKLKLPIDNVNVDEDAPKKEITLSNHFEDIDSDLTYKVINNNNGSLLSPSINGNTLTLEFSKDQNGEAKIKVQATGDGKSVTDTFTVNVDPVDDPLFVDKPRENLSVEEDNPNEVIDLSKVFKDIDSQITLAFSDDNNTNQNLVKATLDSESQTLSLNFEADQHGEADVTVTANSDGKPVEDSFTVTVAPVDDPPRLIKEINDLNVLEDADNTNINLSEHFEDVDSVINYSVVANNNTGMVKDSANGNILNLDYVQDKYGSGDITVRAESNGLSVEDTFTVNVAPVDDPPKVVNPIADVSVNEDAPATSIDLSNVFSDIDNEDAAITKAVITNSNSGLVTPVIDGNNLSLNYIPNASGMAEITVEGTSNGLTVSDTFTVNVAPVDDPIVVVNQIADVSVNEDAPATSIDLSNVFSDIDNEDAAITKAVITNSNSGLVTPVIDGNNLSLNYIPNASGMAEITVEGTSNGLTVSDTFTVNVAPVDDPIVVVNQIADVSVNEDAPATSIDLSNVFSDI
ncbi:MAG: pre-peptidase C-terminal domain-containing protein, partial [Trichodesmium erythraeum GBRTRLIN201]|nr:pre-peptidase C-terminal domain-containing protein [Trichodesmium erythraeum GBRTRLIN201]